MRRRRIYQGCRTIVFACKLHSSLGKMLLSRRITSFPFVSLEDVFYKTSNLGDHILKTVSSISLNQIHFKNGRGFKKKKAQKLTFFLKRNICLHRHACHCAKQHSWFFYWCSAITSRSSSVGKKGLVYKVAFCRLSEVNFIRSTARCASHVTQSSSLLMKCCIQISACGLKGIRPW